MFRLKVWFWTIGLVFIQTFTACVIWNVAKPNPVYIAMLETVFPGFKWLSIGSFVMALAECFLYAAWLAFSFCFEPQFLLSKTSAPSRNSEGPWEPA